MKFCSLRENLQPNFYENFSIFNCTTIFFFGSHPVLEDNKNQLVSNFLRRVENDLQALEQTRLDIMGKSHHLEKSVIFFLLFNSLFLFNKEENHFSKNEPELINLLAQASDIQSRLVEKQTEHEKYLNVKNRK